MTYTIKYKRLKVEVSGEKPDRCECCLSRGKIDAHHFNYAYTTDEIRKNPEWAKKNVIYLNYPCHRVADALRVVMKDLKRVKVLERLISEKINNA